MASALTTGGRTDGGEQLAAHPHPGTIDRDGVQIAWWSHGAGEPAILLLPTWSIVHSRCWKLQVPYLARRHRVLTFDPRGNGASDRPLEPAAYAEDEFAADALSVMDAAGVDRAVLVGLSLGAQRALILAGEHPERVSAMVLVGPSLPVGAWRTSEGDAEARFTTDLGVDEGWARYNAHSWRRDYRGFLEFFFSECFVEPHSTKVIEDCIGWALETDAETLITAEGAQLESERVEALCARVQCPVLVVHGSEDRIVPHKVGATAAELLHGSLVTFDGSGHCPHARDSVRFNRLLTQFVASVWRAADRTG